MTEPESKALLLVVPWAVQMGAAKAGVSDLLQSLRNVARADAGLVRYEYPKESEAKSENIIDHKDDKVRQPSFAINILFDALDPEMQRGFAKSEVSDEIAVQMLESIPPHIREKTTEMAGLTQIEVINGLKLRAREISPNDDRIPASSLAAPTPTTGSSADAVVKEVEEASSADVDATHGSADRQVDQQLQSQAEVAKQNEENTIKDAATKAKSSPSIPASAKSKANAKTKSNTKVVDDDDDEDDDEEEDDGPKELNTQAIIAFMETIYEPLPAELKIRFRRARTASQATLRQLLLTIPPLMRDRAARMGVKNVVKVLCDRANLDTEESILQYEKQAREEKEAAEREADRERRDALAAKKTPIIEDDDEYEGYNDDDNDDDDDDDNDDDDDDGYEDLESDIEPARKSTPKSGASPPRIQTLHVSGAAKPKDPPRDIYDTFVDHPFVVNLYDGLPDQMKKEFAMTELEFPLAKFAAPPHIVTEARNLGMDNVFIALRRRAYAIEAAKKEGKSQAKARQSNSKKSQSQSHGRTQRKTVPSASS